MPGGSKSLNAFPVSAAHQCQHDEGLRIELIPVPGKTFPTLAGKTSLMGSIFLTAEWRKLAMANYAVDPAILTPYLPFKTELDYWQDTCYVSLVGFMFRETSIRGFRVPFHVHFEEVNLRFYVRYNAGDQWKRGVVFIKEIVPRRALTWVANTIYKENYETMPMSHSWILSGDELTTTYRWKKKRWNEFKVLASSTLTLMIADSEEAFITEHFWGYTRLGDTTTSEYEVAHPTWDLYPVKSYEIDVDFETLYGKKFAFLANEKPRSVLLAEGSPVKIMRGTRI